MKTLSTLSIAIIATYIMSSVAGAADTGTQSSEPKAEPVAAAPASTEQTTDLSSHAPAQTAEQKPAADAAVPDTAAKTQAPRALTTEKSALQMRLRTIMINYAKEDKDGVSHKPADAKLIAWLQAQPRNKDKKLPIDDIKFRRALAKALNTRDRELAEVAGAPPAPPKDPAQPHGTEKNDDDPPPRYAAGNGDVDQALTALRAKQVELDNEKERTLAAEKRADESAAAFQRCTADCANAKNELAELRAKLREDAAAAAAAQDDARRGDDEVRSKRRPSTDPYRDDDDVDGEDLGRGRRRHPGRSRTGGHTPSEVLGNLFGNNASPYNLYGNNPFNSPLYNPYNMNNPMMNPLLFGQNGMQNPYNNWMNQQRMAQMMMGNQYMNSPYGMMNGRQLPNMYPAPGGGGFNGYPQNPWGANPWNRGPGAPAMMMGGSPYAMRSPYAMGGAPMTAPFMGGISSPFGGVGPGASFNNGGYTVRPVGGMSAPPVMPYGGVGGFGSGIGGIGGGAYGGGYGGYGLGGNYSYGYQYGGRPTLPNVYRLY